MKNSRIKNGILRIVQGIIIGAGAILPGISGGVLAVVFGIYRPAMELLTPHVAGNMTLGYTCDKSVQMFCDDLENYAAGRPLAHLVDRKRGY